MAPRTAVRARRRRGATRANGSVTVRMCCPMMLPDRRATTLPRSLPDTRSGSWQSGREGPFSPLGVAILLGAHAMCPPAWPFATHRGRIPWPPRPFPPVTSGVLSVPLFAAGRSAGRRGPGGRRHPGRPPGGLGLGGGRGRRRPVPGTVLLRGAQLPHRLQAGEQALVLRRHLVVGHERGRHGAAHLPAGPLVPGLAADRRG